MIDIIYGSNKNIDINDEPELIVIKEHLAEHYTDKDIHIFPFMNNKEKKITASFYINGRCTISTSKFGHAWIGRIRCKKELISKLSLIGFEII